MFGVLLEEAKKIVRTPSRLGQVFHLRRWKQFFGVLWFNARNGDRWKPAAGGGEFRRREYSSYDEYVRHQQSKFPHLDLAEYDRRYREQLRERLRGLSFLKPGANVLCLGARQGTEVKAFLDLGCFAVGIDLNPGGENKYVLRGDFHDVQFPSASVDGIFTNSLDHVYDVDKFFGEIARLLKPDGTVIIEASRGDAENVSPDYYASFWWKKIDDLIVLLERRRFRLIRRLPFAEPWPGEQLCFSIAPQS